jgi:hypothetical protein
VFERNKRTLKYFPDTINGYRIEVRIWPESGYSSRYGGQVSCPVKKCQKFYNTTYKMSESKAKATVKASLQRHMNKEHSSSA